MFARAARSSAVLDAPDELGGTVRGWDPRFGAHGSTAEGGDHEGGAADSAPGGAADGAHGSMGSGEWTAASRTT
ncbi:MAG: hypothetical protein ACREQ5_27385 [Candidatus Dormibacteria bacterium]